MRAAARLRPAQQTFLEATGFEPKPGRTAILPDAKGAVGAGTIPALASNPKLAGAAYPIMVVARGQGAMPGFAGTLSNAQMAEAVTYVRTHFGNNYAKPVTEADVAKFAKPPSAGGH